MREILIKTLILFTLLSMSNCVSWYYRINSNGKDRVSMIRQKQLYCLFGHPPLYDDAVLCNVEDTGDLDCIVADEDSRKEAK